MKAHQVIGFDQPAQLTDIQMPGVYAGEVLLKIEACGLNFADLLMAKGTYQDTPEPPFTLGLEVCGVVQQVAQDVKNVAIGERVAVFSGKGGLAEFGVFPAERCIKVPDNMSSIDAAGFQVAYGTSHLALTRRARLAKGENLLVLGAAGGVGLTAIEVGKAIGANVIAFARGAEKVAIAREAGANHAFDSDTTDILQTVKDLGGADVVYDPVGGEAFKAALRSCNREARVLTIGFASGDVPQIPANIILVKNIDVIGFYWGGYLKFAPEALTASLSELLEWFAEGKLKPHTSHVFPLENSQEALDTLAARKSTGKVVVTP